MGVSRFVYRCFDCLDRLCIHEFHRRWDNPRCNDIGNRLAAFLHRMKRRQHCLDGLWLRQQTNGDFGHNGERSLRSNNYPNKIHPDHFTGRIPETNNFAFGGYGLDRQDVIRRHSIL